MPVITDVAVAEARLRRDLQPDVCPTVDPTEVSELLDANQVCTTWVAGATYSIGNWVVPTTNNRNGHKYRCIAFDGSGVTSGTIEPSWAGTGLSGLTFMIPNVRTQGRIYDGHVVWEEDGAEVDFWDITTATYQGWMLKASKASPKANWNAGGTRVDLDQQYKHCIEQANRYLPVGCV